MVKSFIVPNYDIFWSCCVLLEKKPQQPVREWEGAALLLAKTCITTVPCWVYVDMNAKPLIQHLKQLKFEINSFQLCQHID